MSPTPNQGGKTYEPTLAGLWRFRVETGPRSASEPAAARPAPTPSCR